MPTTAPMVADFGDLQSGGMKEWAARIVASMATLHSQLEARALASSAFSPVWLS